MMVSLTEEQFKSICHVLRGISGGIMGYRLRLSEDNEHYNILAQYLNLIGELNMPQMVEQGKLNKEVNVPVFRESNYRDAGPERQEKKRISEIVDYIEQNLDGPMPKTKDMARQFGFSEKGLLQSFKSVHKKTPSAFYIDKKLERAMDLLQNTALSIEVIASTVGYSSKSSFYKAFKQKYGVTPGEVERGI